jgi:type II secretory pathway pseudopilin PulG
MHTGARRTTAGFTLIELLLILAMTLILMQVASINLFRFQQNASVAASVSTFVSDVRHQQMRAMMGDTAFTGSPLDFGARVESDRYILFRGSTYTAGASTNFSIPLDGNIRVTANTLPGGIARFTRGSGELASATGTHVVTFTDSNSGMAISVTFNRLGVMTIID